MLKRTLLLLLGLAGAALSARAMSADERRGYLDWMRQNLPDDPEWNAWQKASGELPPDFDALPRVNALPDPLRGADGHEVQSAAEWPSRRAEIRQLFEKYVTGTFPPKPVLAAAVVTEETAGEGYRVRQVRLEFGPGQKGILHVAVTIPDGAGPFPALIHPDLSPAGPPGTWEPLLIRRGYVSVAFAGNDRMDDAEAYQALYPAYDFATLPRRAWSVQLVLDYLETVPQVDMKRVGLFGYSRDGKMATMAAALDERIGALVAGSTGVGGILPWRIAGERGHGEGIETTTRMFPTWFVPRLRFFSGHEDRLPVDGNSLVALIAPRPVLLEYGLNDEVSNSWGSEQTYHSAIAVYRLLGRPDGIGLMRVPGFHGANDTEACIDWLDIQFGRSPRTWTNNFLFPWSFDAWRRQSGEEADLKQEYALGTLKAAGSLADWEKQAAQIGPTIAWFLGDQPPTMAGFPVRNPFAGRMARGPLPGPTVVALGATGNPGQLAPDVPAWVISRGGPEFGWLEPEKNQVESRKLRFGVNLTGDLYLPAGTPKDAKLPTVVWLHGFSYPLGYMWVYRRDLHPILALVKAGYAVLAYDQCGFGSRMGESGPFYDRFPHWSLLGRMVEDARSAVDALAKDSAVDPQHIYLFGYTLGGTVGLYTAALDPRVRGVVSVCGFTPLRTDTADRGTSGVARYSETRGLLPRLGFFVGHEAQIPFDYDQVIALAAPRPVLIVQPTMDREANPGDVHAAVEEARKVYAFYGAAGSLGLDEPVDYARLPNATQDRIIAWMRAHP